MIITANPDRILNKRFKLISKCRHENKFYLRNNYVGKSETGFSLRLNNHTNHIKKEIVASNSFSTFHITQELITLTMRH